MRCIRKRFNPYRKIVPLHDAFDLKTVVRAVKQIIIKVLLFIASKLGDTGIGGVVKRMLVKIISMLEKASSSSSESDAGQKLSLAVREINKTTSLVKSYNLPSGEKFGIIRPLTLALGILVPVIKVASSGSGFGSSGGNGSGGRTPNGRPAAIGHDPYSNPKALPYDPNPEQYLVNKAWEYDDWIEHSSQRAVRLTRTLFGVRNRPLNEFKREFYQRQLMNEEDSLHDIHKNLSELLSKSKTPQARKEIFKQINKVKEAFGEIRMEKERWSRVKERAERENEMYGKKEPKAGEFNSNKGFSEQGRFSNLDSCNWRRRDSMTHLIHMRTRYNDGFVDMAKRGFELLKKALKIIGDAGLRVLSFVSQVVKFLIMIYSTRAVFDYMSAKDKLEAIARGLNYNENIIDDLLREPRRRVLAKLGFSLLKGAVAMAITLLSDKIIAQAKKKLRE